MNLGETIYRLRTQKNMSQLDLADALGVSRQSVSKWETGVAIPELDKLIAMAELFDISLDALVGREVPPTPSAPEVTVKSWLSEVPRRKIVGAILLIGAFLALLFGNFLVIPSLALAGAACFVFSQHTGLWCAWAAVMPFCILPVGQFAPRLGSLRLVLQIPLAICTIWVFRKEKKELDAKGKLIYGAGWLALVILFLLGLPTTGELPASWGGMFLQGFANGLMIPLLTWLISTFIRAFRII